MKSTRQNIILQIIAEQEIETQNQLMDVLAQRGVPSTQATLSRDIKELHLTKTLAPSGKYRYAAPAADEFPGYDERLKKIFRECVTSYAEAQNIIVIKTLPGLGCMLRARQYAHRHARRHACGRRHGISAHEGQYVRR